MTAHDRCETIRRRLEADGIFAGWRVSPEPFWISPEELAFLKELGGHLLSFYEGLNTLYWESVYGRQPRWVSEYLERGKPETVKEFGRINRFRHLLPGVIRPDIIPTEGGWVITELDSVPGGMGVTGSLSRHYSFFCDSIVGSGDGMVDGFAGMIRSLSPVVDPTVAIVVSDESKDYRPEMRWLGEALRKKGLRTHVVEPREVVLVEERLCAREGQEHHRIDILYRFFELFDLKNIPRADLILYGAKKEWVVVTPPFKAYLEEKMAFAFFHHPVLTSFWKEVLGPEGYALLHRLFPRTWILDSAEVPPYAVIPDLLVGGRPVSSWRDLFPCTQKERQFVIKPSGFSALAWGSRGVSIGHDLSREEWIATLERSVASFSSTPHILQEFHKGKKFPVEFYDPERSSLIQERGRVRLSPYYFVVEGKATLSGVLATICPLDKKLLHGMKEAVMVPCGVRGPSTGKETVREQ